MVWWIPMAISAASSISQSASQSAQNRTQKAYNSYNANMQYATDMTNVAMNMAVSSINAQLAMQQSAVQQEAIKATTELNAKIIAETTLYNDALYEEELSMLWDSVNLDLKQMENQRAVERGAIEAQQGASGTVIGEGSNQDVIINQKTQEAMDAFIVKHNADKQAAQISNARAQSLWQGDMEIKKTLYEGSVNMAVAKYNGEAQARATMIGGGIQAIAGSYTAGQALQAGRQGLNMKYTMNQNQINTNMASGLFGAASQGVQSYYKYKPTQTGSAGSSLAVS